jgi:hypothetical protein
MSRSSVTAALFLSSLLLSACSKPAEPAAETAAPVSEQSATSAPASAATSAPAPAAVPAAAAPAATVIASASYSQDPNLRADLLEVKRVSGGALLVKWRVVNAAPASSAGLAAASTEPIHYDFGWDDIYYVDPAENKKYGYLTDSEGGRILDIWWGNLKPGEQRANWAKFPAPPATSNKISLTLPKFPPFEDVPVS